MAKSAADNDQDNDVDTKLQHKIKESIVHTSDVSYNDIIGLENVKFLLNEKIIFPMKYPTVMSKVGESKGILLFGVSVHAVHELNL